MPGSGQRGQHRIELHGDPRDAVEPFGTGAPRQVQQVARTPLGIANPQPRQPALEQVGNHVVSGEPLGGHWGSASISWQVASGQ